METILLIPEKAVIIHQLYFYFRYIEVCKRVNKLIIPLYHKHSQTQLVVNLDSGICLVFEKGRQVKYYHSYKEVILYEIYKLKKGLT